MHLRLFDDESRTSSPTYLLTRRAINVADSSTFGCNFHRSADHVDRAASLGMFAIFVSSVVFVIPIRCLPHVAASIVSMLPMASESAPKKALNSV